MEILDFVRENTLHDKDIYGFSVNEKEFQILISNNDNSSPIKLIFSGFEDIYYDVQFCIYSIDKDLNIKGKECCLCDFDQNILHKEDICIIDVFGRDGKIIFYGWLYDKKTSEYCSRIMITIYANNVEINI